MARYIENKKIDMTKSNNINELQGIGKAAWKFVSIFYKARWDLLVANVHNNIFRQKVSFYCILKTNPVKIGKSKGKDTDKPASIERLPSPIPIKTSKEINKISKFFRIKKPTQVNVSQGKSYVQASRTGNNTKDILKIKEAFPTLKAKNIQQMIKGDSKPKPCINMTTKGLFRKQVIVPINDVNRKNFMKESSVYVTNMNKTIKSPYL